MSEAAAAAVAPGRDTSRPLPFARAARGVFDLSLDGMVWSRRSVVIALLLGVPIVLALVYRGVLGRLPPQVAAFDFYGNIVVFYYLRFALPLAALFYATALIADEVDGKTLTFLITRPVHRSAILCGKFAAYVATTLALSLPPVVVSFFLLATANGMAGIGSKVPDLFRDLGVMALALLAYGALFTFVGVLLRRPVIPGLLFIFVWEWLSYLPGWLPRFTLTAWLQSLIRHQPAQEDFFGMFRQILPAALSLEVLTVATASFLALALWIFSRREYVMDQ